MTDDKLSLSSRRREAEQLAHRAKLAMQRGNLSFVICHHHGHALNNAFFEAIDIK
jgi:hypothetical protein